MMSIPPKAPIGVRLRPATLLVAVGALLLAMVWGFPLFWSLAATVAPEPGQSPMAGFALYGRLLFQTPIGVWYLNSLITSGGVTLGVLAISAPCAYAISQLRFRGRGLLWGMILASFMIPVQALIVSHFLLMHEWRLINTWLGVILPQLIAPVAVIVYKQFFDAMPRELPEAATIDGAGHWRLLFSLFLPLNGGVTAALGIITFIGAWNAFLWPFLAVSREPLLNVTVAVTQSPDFYGVAGLAVAMLAGLPVAITYLLFQHRVTEAVALSAGIKG
jgi:multiple sugar transport system permease protein